MSKTEKQEAILQRLIKAVQQKDPETIKIALPGFLAKKSISYMLIREDLLFIKAVCSRLITYKKENEQDKVLITALWQSFIVTYGKCFTENDGGFSKLTKEIISSDEFLETHEQLMNLRHSFIAHRDDSEKEMGFIYMRLPATGELTGQTEYQIQSSKQWSPSIEEAERYLSLCNHLIGAVSEKIQRQTQKAHEALLSNFSPQELAMMRF
jgi:hypothetical protein